MGCLGEETSTVNLISNPDPPGRKYIGEPKSLLSKYMYCCVLQVALLVFHRKMSEVDENLLEAKEKVEQNIYAMLFLKIPPSF